MASSVKLIPLIKFRWFDTNGNPLVAGKVYTYVTNTLTPLSTYLDSSGDTLNANPIILDANGEADIYLQQGRGYRIVVKTAAEATLETIDGVYGSAAVASDSWINIQTFGATGDGTTDDTVAVQAAINAAVTANKTLFVPMGDYKITDGISIAGKLTMEGEGMNSSRFTYTKTTGSMFSWSADGSYSSFKMLRFQGPSRTLGQTATCFTTYQAAACVFYVWEQCWIENFPLWGIDLNDSFCCAIRDSRIRQNGVTASLVGLGLDGQGGGIQLQRITFSGSASTGNDYTNCYFTGNNWGIQVLPGGTNQKAFNTRLDNCFFEENWIGVDIRNLGSGGQGRYQFLNTCYFEANIFAGAMLDEGTTISCYQNQTTAGTGTPPSWSLDGKDGINFSARYLEDRPSRFVVGNKGSTPATYSRTQAFVVDKTETANCISTARFSNSGAITFQSTSTSDPINIVSLWAGAGSPEASVTANSGSLYFRNNGGALNNQLYVKTEDSTDTGWYAMGPQFGTTANRPTSDAVTKGLQYYDTDILRVVTANGSGAYREYNGLTTVTDTYANIPANLEGAQFYATDLDCVFVNDGARWRQLKAPTIFQSATNGGTTTIQARGETRVSAATGTIATHTLVLPSGADAVSGDHVVFVVSGIITALTVTSGATIVNAPTTMAAGTSVEFIYNDTATTWYRVR